MNDETDEFGFLTKKSRFYYLWENYIAVSRLLFGKNGCFTRFK